MKARLLTSVVFLLLFVASEAQNLIRESLALVESNQYQQVIEYQYDEEGRKIEALTQTWDEENKAFFQNKKWQCSYDKGNLKSESRFTRKTMEEAWQNRYSRQIAYDEAGCLQSVEISRYFPGFGYEESFINYENEFACSFPWRGETERFFDEGAYTVTRKIKDDIEIETLTAWSDNTFYRERSYNSKGLLVYDYDRWIFSSGKGALRELEYDEYDNCISEKRYTERELGVFDLVAKTYYENRYENDRLVETISRYFFETEEPYAIARNEYKYYCDGLLKSDTKFYNDAEESTTTYEYDQGTNCESEEELDLYIYPNPHTDYFIIESNGLAFENTIVNIYSLDGRLVDRQEIPERLLQLKIETPVAVANALAPVSEEFLIVQVISKGKSFSEKILRFK